MINRLFMISGSWSIISVLLFIVMIPSDIKAETNAEVLFAEANKAYLDKDYDQAIALYEEIIKNDYESAALYYNLGNAYYRTGKIGFAILNYERALKLSPNDEDLKHNLALANIRITDKIETLPEFFIFKWWEALLDFFTLRQWIYAALLFYLLVLTAAGFYFFAYPGPKQKAILLGGILSVVLLVFTVSLLIVKYNREVNEQRGVITARQAVVKIAPDASAGDTFIVHEGLKIKVEDKVNEWHKIRLIDGKIGWIRSMDLEII